MGYKHKLCTSFDVSACKQDSSYRGGKLQVFLCLADAAIQQIDQVVVTEESNEIKRSKTSAAFQRHSLHYLRQYVGPIE